MPSSRAALPPSWCPAPSVARRAIARAQGAGTALALSALLVLPPAALLRGSVGPIRVALLEALEHTRATEGLLQALLLAVNVCKP